MFQDAQGEPLNQYTFYSDRGLRVSPKVYGRILDLSADLFFIQFDNGFTIKAEGKEAEDYANLLHPVGIEKIKERIWELRSHESWLEVNLRQASHLAGTAFLSSAPTSPNSSQNTSQIGIYDLFRGGPQKLTTQVINCLEDARLDTLAQVLEKSERELREIRNIGPKSVDYIRKRLKERGYDLRKE